VLCFLSLPQVAYEHDEDFSSHLALLLHLSLLLADADEPLVADSVAALLINLLYSLAARQLELAQEQQQGASDAVSALPVRNT
jgi:Cell morphogenesis central region